MHSGEVARSPVPGRPSSTKFHEALLEQFSKVGLVELGLPMNYRALFRQFLNRLLLCEAMERPKPEDEVDGVDADYGAIREKLAERSQSDSIVGIIKRWNYNSRIGNIKIGVVGRETVVVKIQRSRHWQRHDFRSGAIFEAQVTDALPIFGQGPVIGVLRIGLTDEHDRVGVHEATDIINVPVRIVANRSRS
jgi:hypothetical protein